MPQDDKTITFEPSSVEDVDDIFYLTQEDLIDSDVLFHTMTPMPLKPSTILYKSVEFKGNAVEDFTDL
jgi:hypothetical protein